MDDGTDAGVTYVCQRCTNCCRWPGFVRVSDGEIARMSAWLGMDERAFIQKFTDLSPARSGLALRNRTDGACVFLDGRDCRVNPVKPDQCAAFPNGWRFPGWRRHCHAIARRA